MMTKGKAERWEAEAEKAEARARATANDPRAIADAIADAAERWLREEGL